MARRKSLWLNRIFQNPLINDLGILFVRVVASLLLMTGHGLGKFKQMLELNFQFLDPIGVGPMVSLIGAAFCEFVFPCFVIVGLFTRIVSIPIVFTMTVAGIVVHGSDPMFPEFLTMGSQNVMTPFKEYALLYALVFVLLVFTGPGRLSLDGLFGFDQKN